jgi:hypothetical protein
LQQSLYRAGSFTTDHSSLLLYMCPFLAVASLL